MRLVRTRPVIVATIRVTGFNWPELDEFCGGDRIRRRIHIRAVNTEPDGIVGEVFSNQHGVWLPLRVGDWIERGAYDELLPVRHHLRAARYQPLHG